MQFSDTVLEEHWNGETRTALYPILPYDPYDQLWRNDFLTSLGSRRCLNDISLGPLMVSLHVDPGRNSDSRHLPPFPSR